MKKHDTFLRQWLMLCLIPRYPTWIDVKKLKQKLSEEGFEVSHRTIQRDLMSLSLLFPLDCDEACKPYRWHWAKEGKVFDVPSMQPSAALGFKLAEEHLKPIMPRATLSYLQPHFERAGQVLNSSEKSGYGLWAAKVKIIPRSFELLPAKIFEDVHDVVYQGLFDELRIDVEYLPRNKQQRANYEVNPLGLVFQQGVIYLVCTLWDYDDIKQLAVHRIKNAKISDKLSQTPEGFDLDKYVETGKFGYLISENKIKITLWFDKQAAFHLNETPISTDQKIKPFKGGGFLVTATVPDTSQLRWWLQAFGDSVEVLEPKSLRSEFVSLAQKLARKYQK